MSNIKCKNCETVIPVENINVQTSIAKCEACDCVFNFNDQVKAPRPTVQIPSKFEILKLRSSLNISYKWFTPVYVFLAFFCLVWNGFMAFWYYTAITEGIWMMAAFGVIHLTVGVFLMYFTLAGFFNTTHINATRNRLKISHTPLWWKGNREIETSYIDQLFCKLKVNRNKNGTTYTYDLFMIDINHKHTKLLSNLESPEYVLYLEQELEAFLGIEDRKVSGELEL